MEDFLDKRSSKRLSQDIAARLSERGVPELELPERGPRVGTLNQKTFFAIGGLIAVLGWVLWIFVESDQKIEKDTPGPNADATALMKAEIVKDLIIMGKMSALYQGIWVFGPIPFVILIGLLAGCLKAHMGEAKMVWRRQGALIILVLCITIPLSIHVKNELVDAFGEFNKDVLPEFVLNLEQSLVTSVLLEIVELVKGEEMMWFLQIRNLLECEVTLNNLTGPISLLTTEKLELVHIELNRSVVIPPASTNISAVVPFKVKVLTEGVLLGTAMVLLFTTMGGLMKIELDLTAHTWINGHTVDLGATGILPLDLAVLRDLIREKVPFIPEDPDKDPNAPSEAPEPQGNIFVKSLLSGLEKQHALDPPEVLINPMSVWVQGYYMIIVFLLAGCFVLLIGGLSTLCCFHIMRERYGIGADFDKKKGRRNSKKRRTIEDDVELS